MVINNESFWIASRQTQWLVVVGKNGEEGDEEKRVPTVVYGLDPAAAYSLCPFC